MNDYWIIKAATQFSVDKIIRGSITLGKTNVKKRPDLHIIEDR